MIDSLKAPEKSEQPQASAVDLFSKNKWLVFAFCVCVLAIAAVQMWLGRFAYVDGHGINYLDHAEAYFGLRDYHTSPVTHWAPLYSWILGVGLWIAEPSRHSEAVLVHGLNLVMFAGALAAFSFFLGQLTAFVRGRMESTGTWPDWIWLILGYSVFAWFMLSLAPLYLGTPDLLVAVFLFAAFGIVLRINRGYMQRREFIALGLVLGLGYLAKPVMIAFAAVFLVAAIARLPTTRLRLSKAAVAVAVLLVIACPWVVARSIREGQVEITGAGSWIYAITVNEVTGKHYQGGIPGIGEPEHPVRQLREDPPVYEFAHPIEGTYPPWYDIPHWYEGVTPSYALSSQLAASQEVAGDLWRIVTAPEVWPFGSVPRWLAPFACLTLFGALIAFSWNGWRRALRNIWALWPVFAPALAVIGVYLLAGEIRSRYLAAVPVVLWLSAFASQPFPQRCGARRIVSVGAVVLASILAVALVRSAQVWSDLPDRNDHAAAADGLENVGVADGDTVVFIGTNAHDAYWARLARVRIVAEIEAPSETSPVEFWEMPSRKRAAIFRQISRESGAGWIVSQVEPPDGGRRWFSVGMGGVRLFVTRAPEVRTPGARAS